MKPGGRDGCMSAQRAMSIHNKVSDLQTKVFHAAKHTLDRKFRALYLNVYLEDMMLEAWKWVGTNKGAPEVDVKDFEYIENEIGICMSIKGCVLQMVIKLTDADDN
jgi:hypothetical protein